MSTLTGALPDSPFCGCEGSDAPPPPPGDLDLPSPETLRTLHADGIRLARNRLMLALAAPVASAVMIAAVIAARLPLYCVIAVAVALLSAFAGALREWIRLRRSDPLESWLRERREEVEEFRAHSEVQARVNSTRPVVSYAVAAAIGLVTLVQFVAGFEPSIAAAALVKPAVRHGEWWRLLSASFLHVNLFHVLVNLSAVVALGTMIEAFDRPLRVPLAYLAGVLGGNLASFQALQATSVGASGGALGLLGYLALSGVGPASSPSWLRKQVLGNLAMIAITGAVGFFFIDNAAHAGGVAAGMIVGAASAAARRISERSVRAVDTWGSVAAALLAAAAVFTAGRLLHAW